MKTLLTCSLSVLFFCLASTTEAQTWQWAKNLYGPNQNHVFGLGDAVRIRIKNADLVNKFLDFEMVDIVPLER